MHHHLPQSCHRAFGSQPGPVVAGGDWRLQVRRRVFSHLFLLSILVFAHSCPPPFSFCRSAITRGEFFNAQRVEVPRLFPQTDSSSLLFSVGERLPLGVRQCVMLDNLLTETLSSPACQQKFPSEFGFVSRANAFRG